MSRENATFVPNLFPLSLIRWLNVCFSIWFLDSVVLIIIFLSVFKRIGNRFVRKLHKLSTCIPLGTGKMGLKIHVFIALT